MLSLFHFLRPWWFIALIPAIILFIVLLKRTSTGKNDWAEHCDPHLLPHLILETRTASRTWSPYLIFTAWLITIIALAGPTWSLYAQPVYQKNIARIIALDVSQSMNSTDVAPSRLERAKYKVLDLLREIKEGQTGMIVFSSDAFVVSPLTTDNNTIASMVPVLDSNIVPVQGLDLSKALNKSAQLLKQAGYSEGQILLITDSTPTDQTFKDAANLAHQGYTTSILAIGSEQGGPVTGTNGNFETDKSGNVVFSRIDSAALKKLATAGAGSYTPFSNDNSDLNQILDTANLNSLSSKPSQEMQTKSLWKDQGDWLIWLLILFSAFIARKGWLEKIC